MNDLSHIGAHIDVRRNRLLIHAGQLITILFIAAIVLANSYGGKVNAADITNRSVRLSTSVASTNLPQTFTFTVAAGASVGSMSFQYCSNSPLRFDPCIPPAGLDASTASITTQSGETGFNIHANTTTNRIVITRLAAVTTGIQSIYEFSNIINQSASQQTSYVRIAAYPTNDGTGAASDNGSVAFATTRSLSVNLFVPPYLAFCVGQTVAADCSSSSGFDINLGLLRSDLANAATSQFAGATNDFLGYNVSLVGNTMTAGNNVIPAMVLAASSIPGAAQFGLNVRSNTNPSVGQDPQGIGTAIPLGGYANPDVFKFVSGDSIANSPISTDYNVFTVSYLVNVPVAQPPGVYTTTMSYIATAAF